MNKKKEKMKDRTVIDERALEFGLRIKQVRKILNLSQKEFAEHIGMANNYLSEIETGKIKPGFDFFYKVSKAFNINLSYLLHGKEPAIIDNDKVSEIDKPMDPESLLKAEDKELWELTRYMRHSNCVYHAVLEFFTRYRILNQDLIDKEWPGRGENPPEITD